jgi:aminoglycoside phosphotransferase (APT) family kinase protein
MTIPQLGFENVIDLTDTTARQGLENFVARAASASSARIMSMRRLGGGAVSENWAVDISIHGSKLSGEHALVVRADAQSRIAESLSRAEEFAVQRAAFLEGVAAPEPLWLCEDTADIGRPFYVMRRASGLADPRRLAREEALVASREALTGQLGQELARLHGIAPPRAELDFLPLPVRDVALARVEQFRAALDAMPEPQPVLEWAIRWLESNAPDPQPVVLCHRDYRTGNYLVDEGRLSAILDWEFAGWSEAYEDIGWFCARCWRFGAVEREAGGIGSRAAFYKGYEQESGRMVDAARVPYWEAVATVRWAVIALQQAQRHLSGREPSLELALTGRLVPELELDLLRHIEAIERARSC